MALQKPYQHMGMDLPEAYFKINPHIVYDYYSGENIVYVCVYANVAAKDNDLMLLDIKYVIPEKDLSEDIGDNDYRDIFYRYLKENQYADALDV